MKALGFLILLFSAIPMTAKAWGPDGHRIICFLADELLPSAKQDKLRALLDDFEFEGFEYGYYSSSCNFADLARANGRKFRSAKKINDTPRIAKFAAWERFDKLSRWHFLNLERKDDTVDASDCPIKDGCVLRAIEENSKTIADGPDYARAEALVMLGHWVGDLHQPMHVSFADDKGGNDIDDVDGIYGKNRKMHGVWDSGILKIAMRKKNEDWLKFARRLLTEIKSDDRTKWESGTPISWAQESFNITVSPATEYCKKTATGCWSLGNSRDFQADYQKANEPVIIERLKMGGVRLAWMLDELLE